MKNITTRQRIDQFICLMGEVLPNGEISNLVDLLGQIGFFEAPASTKYHGNYPGGLYDHSFAVTTCLIDLTRKLGLKWDRMCSPYIVGMFHDLCKCDNYIQQEDGTYEYNKNLCLIGHGEKSVIIAQKLYALTEEELMCIRWHMGAYEGDKVWNNLREAIRVYPTVLYTHTADMIASQIIGT